MEVGRIVDKGQVAQYSSDVASMSPSELAAFYERVNHWAACGGVIMGEGAINIQENPRGSRLPISIVLRAPLIEGNIDNAFYLASDPVVSD